MKIAWLNRIDSCDLSASTLGAGDLTVERVQIDPLTLKYRVQASTVTIAFDFGSATAWEVFGVPGTNLTTAATKRITLSNQSVTGTDILDTGTISAGVLDGYPQVYHSLSAPLTARYGRIILADASMSFIDIGRVVAGPAWTPTIGDQYGGRQIMHGDDSVLSKSLGGQQRGSIGPRPRRFSFQLDYLSEAEMLDNAFEIDRVAGLTRGILVMLDPASELQRLSVYCHVTRMAPVRYAQYGRHAKRYEIEERL